MKKFVDILSKMISSVEIHPLYRYQIISLILFILLVINIMKLLSPSSSVAASTELHCSSSNISSTCCTMTSSIATSQSQQSQNTSSWIVNIFFLFFSFFIIKLFKNLTSIFHKEYQIYSDIYQQLQISKESFHLFEYFIYRIDIYWSQDRRFKSFALLTVIILLILFGGLFWKFFVGDHLFESFWISWTFLADPGTHAIHTGLVQRIISFIMTIGGMIVFAFVIGIVSEDLSEFVDKLREGKSRVIVTNHTLILGQGEMLLPIVQQIALANESLGGGSIVILSSVPKNTLEKLIEAENMNLYGSDVIVRTGLPHLQTDLRNVSAAAARAIVILADKSSPDPDVNIVRTVLSLRGLGAPTNGHIVAEIHRSDNEQLVKIVGQAAVETFITHNFVGKMLIHCARERGLAQVFEQLLGFEGCEFYVKEWPDLVGLTFGEVLYRFEDAVVIGVIRSSDSVDGTPLPLLNPPNDLVILSGDRIVVIAEDDDTYQSSAVPLYTDADEEELFLSSSVYQPRKKAIEKILVVGWKEPMIGIFHEFNASACAGSEMTIFSPLPIEYRQEVVRSMMTSLENITISNIQGNPISRRDLEKLPLEVYDSILILAAESNFRSLNETQRHSVNANRDILQTDSCSLATLLLIRDIQSRRNLRTRGRSSRTIFDADYVPPSPKLLRLDSDFSEDDMSMSPVKTPAVFSIRKGSIISEITNASTKPLMSVASVTDYVPSTELVSRALSMIAEQREVNYILKQLLSSDGNEIYLVPISCYIRRGVFVSFYQLMAITNQRKHLLIGYKNDERIVLNPRKKSKKRKWTSKAELIIIARGLE